MKVWLRVLAGLFIVWVGLAGLAIRQGSPQGFRERTGRLASAELAELEGDAPSRVWAVRLRSTSGLEVRALLRVPRSPPGPWPAAVLVGGIKRGRGIATVAGLETVARQAILVSPDAPLRLPPGRLGIFRGLATLLRLRPAAFDAVAAVLLLLDHLEARPDVDRTRLLLVGGSLGALPVIIAGGVDPRPAAVIALYGGGRVGEFVAHLLEHPSQRVRLHHWQAVLAGHALTGLLAPLRPERYAPRIAPRPFLMVNGLDDTLVPRQSVLALYQAARPPKDLLWVGGEHIRPSRPELLEELSGLVLAWLAKQGLIPASPVAQGS